MDGKTPRILLTGANGQVGIELRRVLPSLGNVVEAVRAPDAGARANDRVPLDLSDVDQIRQVVREVQPDLIVNAAAYTAVDRAEREYEESLRINGTAPGVLAEEAKRLGASIVHYSTDYVFDGAGTKPWLETDATQPLNAYGRTKLAGEQAIRDLDVPHLILRISWVYGLGRGNFVTAILNRAADHETLTVVADQVGAPTSARVVADSTLQILKRCRGEYAGVLRERGGIVHLTCAGTTSWHGFATEIVRLARAAGLPLAAKRVDPITAAEYPTPARRPANSRMDLGLLTSRFDLSPPAWDAALAEIFPEIIASRSNAVAS
ncbi:MAG TPA: dTDP-4-dehydrorhamnose reductase [Pirellulales bacterium]|jgi:dTDP-4-dehydrorhamnose reductase|nr:dTDP-4-dehydrorhamnose reductase [Pirellulales bacterium]